MEMTQTLTIELPKPLYKQLRRAAELAHESVVSVIQQSLTYSLPPLLDDIPLEYQADVYPLLQMNVEALQGEVQSIFPTDQWRIYESLLNKRKQTSLTESEQVELDKLQHEADVLMFRKGYAAVLLKRQGYHTPLPSKLPVI